MTSYHTLSHLFPQVGSKTIFIWQLFNQLPGPNFVITSYHALLLLITSYHALSTSLEEKLFSFDNFKISSQSPNFLSHLITPCHILSHLITPYLLGWKKNHFHLATLKLVRRPQFCYHILSRLVTTYNILSHPIPQVGSKTIFIWQI